MPNATLSYVAAALVTTFAIAASAQQQPGTNVPTSLPAAAEANSTPTTTALEEPVIDAETNRSTIPNTPLLVTGLVVLGASYGASVIGAAVSDRASDDKLNYPVVGPWMSLNDRDCAADPCKNKTLGTTLLIGSGVLQGIGALSAVFSLVIPQETTRSWYLIGNDDLIVTPLVGSGEVGAAALGRF